MALIFETITIAIANNRAKISFNKGNFLNKFLEFNLFAKQVHTNMSAERYRANAIWKPISGLIFPAL